MRLFLTFIALLSLPAMAIAQSTISSAGVSTTGYIYANGIVSASSFRGDGSLLTNILPPSANSIVSDTHNLTISSTGVLSQNFNGNGYFQMKATGLNAIELGANRSTNDFAFIDLVGDATYTDFGLRLIRDNTGPNAQSWLTHRGTGNLNISTNEAAPIVFFTNGIEHMYISSSGNIGIGTTTPTEKLEVAGGNVSMGWETITNACSGGTNLSCVANCSSTKRTIGGGCDVTASSGGSIAIQNASPRSTSYNCSFSGDYTSASVRAYAICANIR